jgi:N-methylhydantoinase B/oxoprolinase/acetone carboxylase alpha subunit
VNEDYSDPDSRQNMAAVDQLPAEFRPLVYEYGLVIVVRMWNDGYEDAEALRPVLETWRQRRQAQWMSTDYIIAQSFSDALIRVRASRGFR